MSKKSEKMKTHSIATLRQIAKGGGLSSVSAEYELKRRGQAVVEPETVELEEDREAA